MNAVTRATSIALVGLVLTAGSLGCSTTKDLGSDESTTTVKHTSTTQDPLDAAALASGAQGVAELQKVIDTLLASNDVCAILTQQALKGARLDPTLLTTPSVRQVLAQGLVQVFDHLIKISPAELKAPLQTEQTIFGQVLDVVQRFSTNPSDTKASDDINSLVSSANYLAAQQQIGSWATANCP